MKRLAKGMGAVLMVCCAAAAVWAAGAGSGGMSIAMEAVPMGALAGSTGGGHYTHLPMFSKDGSHVFLLVGQGSKMSAYVDGVAGPTVVDVRTTTSGGPGGSSGRSPAFSEDGQRVGYVAVAENSKAMVVVNGSSSPVYDGVPWFSFAPAGHRFAYIVQQSPPTGANGVVQGTGSMFAVDDGKAGLTYEQVNGNLAAFSADGKHFAYVGISKADPNAKPVTDQNKQAQRWRVVLDGKEMGLRFENILKPVFSKDGNHLVYIAGTDGYTPTRVVVDDKEGKTYAFVEKLAISDDGSRVVYAAKTGAMNSNTQKNFVVDNGVEGATESAIMEVAVSPDGKRVAYYALGQTGPGSVVENGQRGAQYQNVLGLRYTPDSGTLLYEATSLGQGTFVVANGKEIGPYARVNLGQVAFSQDGHHWACWVEKVGGGAQFAVVEDGKEVAMNPGVAPGDLKFQEVSGGGTGRLIMMSRTTSSGAPVAIDVHAAPVPAQDVPSDLVYSSNKQHWIKVKTENYGGSQAKETVSVDDKPALADAYLGVKKLAVSDDGGHFGFIGTKYGAAPGSLTRAIYDGKEGPSYNSIWDLALSPDGKHVAYVAQDGPGSTGNWFVVVDGVKGPAFTDVIPTTAYQDGDVRLRWGADGSLRFYAALNGQLMRCSYGAGAFNGAPSMAVVEAEKPGLKVLHSWEGPGHTAIRVVMGAEGELYGICLGEGKFKKGVLYKMKTDGSGYEVLHDFFGGDADGEHPVSLIMEPDGKLLGALDQGKVFRYDPKTKDYALVEITKRGYGPNWIAGRTADGKIIGMGGGAGATRSELFSMAPDGSGYATVNNTQFGKPPLMYEQIIQAKDGGFFAVSSGANSVLVKFKNLTEPATVVHKFVNSPTDGTGPDNDMVLDSNGNLYGTTSRGGMSQHGVIYRVDADGSNYKVIHNPEDFKFSKLIAAGDDGKVYGMTPEGLLVVDPAAPEKPAEVVVPFTGKPDMNAQGFPEVVFHEGVLYAVTNKALYRVPVSLPKSGPASALPSVAVQTGAPAAAFTETVAFTSPTGAGGGAGVGPGAAPGAAQQPGQASGQPQQTAGQSPQQPGQQPGPRQGQQPPPRTNQPPRNVNDAVNQANDAANRLRGLFGR